VAFIPHAPTPDPSLIAPGETFTQTWTLQNVGNVAWRARSLVRLDEELVIARRVGTFTTVWHMRDERGQASFPRDFFLQTVVTVIGF
jgi:hypothetical protein